MNNNIISQNLQHVNIIVAKSSHVPEKWADKRKMALAVSRRISEINGNSNGYYKRRSERMANCSTELVYYYCHDCGHVQISHARLCRDRVCPICTWRSALRHYAEMIQTLDVFYGKHSNGVSAYFVTLTVPNCEPSHIDRTLSDMSLKWNKICHRAWYKENIVGWARRVEITYNKETGKLHPHFHLILLSKSIPYTIVQQWLQYNTDATAAAQDMQRIDAASTEPVDLEEPNRSIVGAILETFKYTTKSSDILSMPLSVLRQYLNGIDGKRLIAYGGLIKDIRAELLFSDESEAGEETSDNEGLCVHCHSPKVEQMVAAWSFDAETYRHIDLSQSEILRDIRRRETISAAN